jgi:hypothetical protein
MARRSQIFYYGWEGRNGRVQRVDGGIELWFPFWEYASLVYGLRGRKSIADRSITSVLRSPQWIRICFDDSDEIMISDVVLDDFPSDVLKGLRVRQDESIELPLHVRVDLMRARQTALGPVSWQLGRLGGRAGTLGSIRLRRLLVVAIPASFVIVRLFERLV